MLLGWRTNDRCGGIAIGAFIPLPFSLAAMLKPSRFNIALAQASWGCWFTAHWYILT